jgi:hypothetical protein
MAWNVYSLRGRRVLPSCHWMTTFQGISHSPYPRYRHPALQLAQLGALTLHCSRILTFRLSCPVSSDINYSAFRYSPLQWEARTSVQPTIRLLELLPGQSIDRLECHLKEVSLFSSPQYEAVSYCWGNPRDQRSIICNNERLNIPRTLEEALRGLRLLDRPRILWVDAVCINQADIAEKDSQVQLMRTIYSQASRTLIWLGELNDRYDKGISVFATLSIKIALAALRWRFLSNECPTILIRDTKTGISRIRLPFSNDFHLDLVRMLRRPWFQRAWVVQEVVVSKKPTILWDSVEYKWEDLVRALKYMSTVNFPLAFIVSMQHVASIENERLRYKSGRIDLLGLLLRHQRCLATDQRDKVYSFCGLIDSSPAKRSVRVNYNDDAASIYREVAVRILQHDQSLDLLSRPPLPTMSKIPGLPSWVPDWSICTNSGMVRTFGLGPRSLAGTEGRFRATTRPQFKTASGSRYLPEYSTTFDELTVEGYVFDAITEVGPVFEGVELPNAVTTLIRVGKSWMDTIRTFLQARMVIINWRQMIQVHSGTVYVTGEPIDEAFWQTVCAGELHKSVPVVFAAQVWKRVTRYSGVRITHIPRFLDPLGLVYSLFLLVWHLISNQPLLEYELQGRYTLNRRMIRTSQCYIGLASCSANVGDQLAICKGSSVPLILRRLGRSDRWELVGDTYLHGAMQGELFVKSKCKKMVLI